MKQKLEAVKTAIIMIFIITLLAVLIITVRRGVRKGITSRTFTIQSETIERKSKMITNCFDFGRIDLDNRIKSAEKIMGNESVQGELLYDIDDGFFDQVLYLNNDGSITGDISLYTTSFVNDLKNTLHSKEDIVALKNGDRNIFVFISPVSITYKFNGVLLGLYDAKHINDLLTDVHNGKPARNVVSFPDGRAVANSKGATSPNKGQNITNILGGKILKHYYSEKDYYEVVKKMQDESIKSFNYKMRGSEGDTLVSAVRIQSTPFLLTQYFQSSENAQMQMENNFFYNSLTIFVFLTFFIILVVMQLYNYKEKRNLVRQAKIDNMTGLLNHNATIDAIEDIIKYSTCGALMVLDIDEFKAINDNYGHLYGDKVIKRISKCICDIFINEEILGRFGGDEFLIYIPNEDSEEKIIQKAEKLINELNALEFSNKCSVSVSIGIAIHQGKGTDVNTLIKNADKAMYYVKNSGKNQYMLYSNMIK